MEKISQAVLDRMDVLHTVIESVCSSNKGPDVSIMFGKDDWDLILTAIEHTIGDNLASDE